MCNVACSVCHCRSSFILAASPYPRMNQILVKLLLLPVFPGIPLNEWDFSPTMAPTASPTAAPSATADGGGTGDDPTDSPTGSLCLTRSTTNRLLGSGHVGSQLVFVWLYYATATPEYVKSKRSASFFSVFVRLYFCLHVNHSVCEMSQNHKIFLFPVFWFSSLPLPGHCCCNEFRERVSDTRRGPGVPPT